jgi:branched-chain amino acid transport system ATP-binding protein
VQTPLLEARDLTKSYGRLRVVDGVSLTVGAGEALGIVGPNGAGKTTLFSLLAGAVAADAGAVLLEGRDVAALPAEARARLGVARTHQIPKPFVKLTVFENALVGACFARGLSERAATPLVGEILRTTGLLSRANRVAGSLPLLGRKRLELARALALAPKVLLLDEIAGGLTEGECRELVALIREINAQGVAIVWIEHIVHALVSATTRLVAMNFGRIVADGAPAEVMASREVREIYLGVAL